MKQARANQLTLQDLEDRSSLRHRRADAVDGIPQALLVVTVDAQGAGILAGERVDIDGEPIAVLGRPVGAAHGAPGVRRRERRGLDAESAEVPANLVE
jgi:hypothetical protein